MKFGVGTIIKVRDGNGEKTAKLAEVPKGDGWLMVYKWDPKRKCYNKRATPIHHSNIIGV